MSPLTPVIIMGVISLVTFSMNILIIYLTIRMKRFTRDVIYLVGLAITDSFPFLIALTFALYYAITKKSPHETLQLTQLFGCIEMSWACLTAQFAASLALYRLSFIYRDKIKRIYTILPYISSTIIIILFIFVAINQEFMLSPSSLSTQPYPHKSTLSAITFYYMFSHVFICHTIVLISYILVLRFTSRIRDGFKIKDNHEEEFPTDELAQRPHFKQINIRGWLFISVSGIILIPGILLFLTVTFMNYNNDIPKVILKQVSAAEGFIFIIGGLVNSLLVLFFHTGINRELKKVFPCFN